MKRIISLMLAAVSVVGLLAVIGVSSFADCESHKWGAWTIVTPATRTSDGKRERFCTVCGAKDEEKIPKRSDPLTDIPDGKWYTAGVLYCYEKRLMNGTAADKFSPNSLLTRAMFVTVLAAIDKADTSKYTGSSFTDVPTGKWYSKPIEWAYKKGYTSGVGNGKFGVNDAVTREQLAVFLYNYTEKKGRQVKNLAGLSAFTDAGSVSKWAVNGVRWAVGNKMISGTSETLLSPRVAATRAQVALIVMNYVENILNAPKDYELPFIPV